MADVTTVAASTWEKQLRTQYAPRYVKSIMSVMRVMFDDAVTSKVRGDNPIPSLRSQRRGKFKGKQQQDEVVIATPRQIQLLARNGRTLRGLPGYAMVVTIAYAGLRINEAAGLRREHLLLEDSGSGCRLVVQEQHQYVDGKPAQVAPKYGSTGSIVLAPFHAELLRRLLASHESPWVFPAPRGGKMDTSAQFYKNTWRRIVDGNPPPLGQQRRDRLPHMQAVAGVENLVPHGARHSMKVWLDELRHPRVAVEARMRHVLPGIEGVYSHTTLAMELAIAEDLQRLWERSLTGGDDVEWEPFRKRRSASPDPAGS
jgi:integrase